MKVIQWIMIPCLLPAKHSWQFPCFRVFETQLALQIAKMLFSACDHELKKLFVGLFSEQKLPCHTFTAMEMLRWYKMERNVKSGGPASPIFGPARPGGGTKIGSGQLSGGPEVPGWAVMGRAAWAGPSHFAMITGRWVGRRRNTHLDVRVFFKSGLYLEELFVRTACKEKQFTVQHSFHEFRQERSSSFPENKRNQIVTMWKASKQRKRPRPREQDMCRGQALTGLCVSVWRHKLENIPVFLYFFFGEKENGGR